MLIAQKSAEYKELEWFEHFINNAINGKEAYLNLVTPIILEAAQFAKKEINVFELDHKHLHSTLFISNFESIKEATADNLMLVEVVEYIKENINKLA